MYANGLFLVYPNFRDQRSFSTNHYEEGVHSVPEGYEVQVPDTIRFERDPGLVDLRFTVPLLDRNESAVIWKTFPVTSSAIKQVFLDSNNGVNIPVVNLHHEREEKGTQGLVENGKEFLKRVKSVDIRLYGVLVERILVESVLISDYE
ncbi:hypothetical protein HK102_001986 [Quaeritorhiza haematococci]|nr:hypothetical protein HK102_001986 [Quaeritorhiza haematococci]